MNILIVANHYPVASGRYAADALRRLGHNVTTIGPARGTHVWGLHLPSRYAWEPQRVPAQVDMTIVMDSDPALLDAIGAPAVVWGVDNHVRDYRRPVFGHYFLAHRNVSVTAWGADCTHLACAYDPAWFTPSPIPYNERAYDVAVLGVMYPQRWAAVERLRAAGLRVIAGAGLVYENYRDAHHNSRIALGLSAVGDVGQRVFEAAAMGCVVVSDRCADFEHLQPDGLWVIDDDLVTDIQSILAAPETAQTMIERSMAWAKPHTWDARAQEVIAWISDHI